MDKYLVSIAFFLLCLECGWLLQDLKIVDFTPVFPQNHHRNADEALGKITKIKSQVKRRSADSLIWEETERQDPLYAYDSVLTLDQSAAELALDGDSAIHLNENTMVVIEPPGNNDTNGPLRLRFKKGVLMTSSGRNPQSIDAGDYVIEASAKTEVTIRSTQNGQIEVESHSGAVKVLDPKTSAVTETIEAGQSAEISKEKGVEVHKSLDISWETPRDGERFYTHSDSAPVSFKWKGAVTNVVFYDHESFRGRAVAVESSAEQGQWTTNLPKGNYVTRLHNTEADTFARGLSVWPAPKIYLISPVVRQRIKHGLPVTFIWTQHPEVTAYILELATDREFKHIVKTIEGPEVTARVDDLDLGEFHWRVRGKDNGGFEIPELYENEFYILENPLSAPRLKTPVIEPIREGSPKPKTSWMERIWRWFLPAAAADSPHKNHYFAEFQWEGVEGADGYIIEVSRTPDFRDLIVSEKASRESYKWRDFSLGKYYWRVAAQAANGEVGIFSEGAFADLTVIPTIPVTADYKPPKPVVVKPPESQELHLLPGERPVKHYPPAAPVAPRPEYTDPWYYSFEFGGHGTFGQYKGSDFTAQTAGMTPGDFRAKILPPAHDADFWRGEFEYHRWVLKAPAASYPFQDVLKVNQWRASFIKDQYSGGHGNYGFGVNQYFLFRRAGLENLSFDPAWTVGPLIDWLDTNGHREIHYRLGAYIGQALVFDFIAGPTWLFPFSEEVTGTVSVEGRANAGISKDANWWFDASGILFLGVRW